MTKITRVLYILSSTAVNGGATKAFMSMLDGLMQKGIEPTVVTPGGDGICQTLKQKGIDTYALPAYRLNTYPDSDTLRNKLLLPPRLLGRMWLRRKAMAALPRICQERHIQMIQSNVSPLGIGISTAHRLGLPHVCHFREYADLDFGFRYFPTKSSFYRSVAGPKDYNICITKGIQQHHRQTGCKRSRVVYDGVKAATPAMPALKKEDYLLYAGRLEPAKCLTDLLHAYHEAQARAGRPLPRLKVAGGVANAAYARAAQQYVAETGLTAQVDFLGNRDDLDALMQRALALVVPSRFEGFGLCMAEAMFNGCLVVGYDNAGTKEQFDNGLRLTGQEIGYRYKDGTQLADILLSLTEAGDSHLDDVRRRAFQAVNQLYTTQANASNMLDFYEQIASEN